VWLKENLKSTKLNDGTPVLNLISNSDWTNNLSGAYCWYNNDANHKESYGALYNWHAVNTGKLCPKGWHVPTDVEWSTLTDHLGGSDIAGLVLKEEGTSHWSGPNTGVTNETRFTALPGGCRYFSGGFDDLTYYGYWWSSSLFSATAGWYMVMYHFTDEVDGLDGNKNHGFSVRCIMD